MNETATSAVEKDNVQVLTDGQPLLNGKPLKSARAEIDRIHALSRQGACCQDG